MKTYAPLAILSALLISFAIYLKPITIFILESYTSILLESKVTIVSLNFTTSKIDAYIENKNNKLQAYIIHLYPLEIKANFTGDINAFKKYHPLDGKTTITADITYDDILKVKAKTTLYKSNTELTLKGLDEGYDIDLNIINMNYSESLNDLNLKLHMHNTDLNIQSSVSLPKIGFTKLELSGIYDEELKADATLTFKTQKLNLSNIDYKNDKLSLDTKFLGSDISLILEDNRAIYKVINLDIEKVLSMLNKDAEAKGLVDIDGETNIKNFKSRVELKIPKLLVDSIEINDVSLESTLDDKQAIFELELSPLNHHIDIRGKSSYDTTFSLQAYSKNFRSDTSFYYSNEKFKLISKHISMRSLQSAFKQDAKFIGDVDITASGTSDNINFSIDSKQLKPNKISTYFQLPFLLNLTGNYTPKTITFTPNISNTNFKLYNGKNIYTLKTKKLNIEQDLVLFYEKENVPIHIKSNILIDKPYTTTAHITHDNDEVYIDKLSYQDTGLKSNFQIDIKELHKYKTITKMDIHGEAKVKGVYDKSLVITTPSLGGFLEIDLDEDALFAKFHSIELSKIDDILNKDSLFKKGHIDGNINYHLDTKSAQSYIVVSDAIVNGVDLDKKLSNLEDVLGLNVVNLSKSMIHTFEFSKEQTNIKHLQLNTSLDDKLLTLNDVALSTDNFLISADGRVKQNGDIKYLKLNILDKNGCAIIEQELKGNIKKPTAVNTSTAIIGLASKIPSSLLGTGKKLVNFSTKTIDGIASFALNTTHISEDKVSLTSDISKSTSSILKDTSDIVLPNECKVIYRGKVKHPKQMQ